MKQPLPRHQSLVSQLPASIQATRAKMTWSIAPFQRAAWALPQPLSVITLDFVRFLLSSVRLFIADLLQKRTSEMHHWLVNYVSAYRVSSFIEGQMKRLAVKYLSKSKRGRDKLKCNNCPIISCVSSPRLLHQMARVWWNSKEGPLLPWEKSFPRSSR